MKKVFYLKVATEKFFTTTCVQFWLNVCHAHDAHIYIICEKENLIRQMKDNLYFGNQLLGDYCLLRAEKSDHVFFGAYFNELNDFSASLVEPYWIKACVSHLSTFYHANKNNFNSFWNIDADDCLFYLPTKKVSEGLKKAERIANEENISLFSFDFWNSETNGEHWSFGITHTRMDVEYIRNSNLNINGGG